MSAKKVSRMLHKRINELLDRILEKGSEELQGLSHQGPDLNGPELNDPDLNDPAQLNLGNADQQLVVSMESFFQFNFDLSQEMDEWIDGKLEESRMDSYQRHWDFFSEEADWDELDERVESNGQVLTCDSIVNSDLPKRPK